MFRCAGVGGPYGYYLIKRCRPSVVADVLIGHRLLPGASWHIHVDDMDVTRYFDYPE